MKSLTTNLIILNREEGTLHLVWNQPSLSNIELNWNRAINSKVMGALLGKDFRVEFKTIEESRCDLEEIVQYTRPQTYFRNN